MDVHTLPWTVHSPGSDVLCSDTLGRTWMLPEMVSDAFLAKAKIGACHRPSPPPPPPPPPPPAPPLLWALSPHFSSCSLRMPNTWAFSLLPSASDRVRSCSAADAMFTDSLRSLNLPWVRAKSQRFCSPSADSTHSAIIVTIAARKQQWNHRPKQWQVWILV